MIIDTDIIAGFAVESFAVLVLPREFVEHLLSQRPIVVVVVRRRSRHILMILISREAARRSPDVSVTLAIHPSNSAVINLIDLIDLR
jgi:hypothetical protein